MAKKLEICTGKKCKKIKSHKQIKLWGKDMIEAGRLKKMKKSKCLGICKEGFALKFKGEVYACTSKENLEKIIE